MLGDEAKPVGPVYKKVTCLKTQKTEVAPCKPLHVHS